MNRPLILSAAALAAASALAFVPTYAQGPDEGQDESASDSSSTPIDLDKIHGPVYVIQDPSTGQTYILVPDSDASNTANDDSEDQASQAPAKAWAPVRGVTYWA